MIQVPIPTDLEPFVQGVVQSGSYRNPTEVVGEALRLWPREQRLHDVKAGVEQLDRGEYTEYGEDAQDEFLADINAEEQNRFLQNVTRLSSQDREVFTKVLDDVDAKPNKASAAAVRTYKSGR